MAKRFTDTNKYRKPFIRGLKGAYKVLWDYLYHDCDHAGIWIVDFEIAQIYIGSDLPVNKQDALKYFNESEIRVVEIDEGKKWFLPSFIDFQYGELNPENRAHKSVINMLNGYNLINENKGLIRGLQAPKDMDMDKDKDKDKEKPDKKIEKTPFDKALKEFKKMRVKIRKPLTERAEKLILSELQKLAPDNEEKKIKILEQSIMNSWASVYPLKAGNNKPEVLKGTKGKYDDRQITSLD